MPQDHHAPALVVSPLIRRTLVVGLFGYVLLRAAMLADRGPRHEGPMADFELFHMVGRMVWNGDILDAYGSASLALAQLQLTGNTDFMPWTYPPPFDLLAALLACGPLGISYLVFTGATLTSFLLVLRRIAGPSSPLVLVAIYPALLMTIACGQNGFLTGTLVGLAALALQRSRTIAGVPLGLMIIKPHLVGAFAVHGLLTGRWRMVAVAVATAGLAGAVTGLVLGPAIWGAALAATREARLFLMAGSYPLHRMISIYAALLSFGVPAGAALLGQAVVAISAMVLLGLAACRPVPARRLLGWTCLGTLFLSPYAYDYDLPIYGIGLGFLMPDLVGLGRRGELVTLLALSAATCPTLLEQGVTFGAHAPVRSFAGPILLGVVALIIRIFRREPGRLFDDAPQNDRRIADPSVLQVGNASSAVGL